MQFSQAGAAHIAITGRSLGALQTASDEVIAIAPGCKVKSIAADLVSESAVGQVFEALPGLPDVVINNAGVSLSQTHVADSDPDAWWRDWEVNVKATYLVTRAYLRAFQQQHQQPSTKTQQGTIVNLSSSVSDLVSPNMSSYGASKTAVNRFTETVQLEYGGRGIRCLAFHPGGIASTGMGKTAPEQFRKRLIDTVDLAAGTALYLSNPRANYLNGRFVYANWDMEKVEKLKEQIVRENLLVAKINYGSTLSTEVEGLPPP